jgi:hypothetical protein
MLAIHIPTNIEKVAFTFSKLEENDSNGSQQAIGEVFVLVAGLNFAQFAKYSLQKYVESFMLFSDQILRYSENLKFSDFKYSLTFKI